MFVFCFLRKKKCRKTKKQKVNFDISELLAAGNLDFCVWVYLCGQGRVVGEGGGNSGKRTMSTAVSKP